MPSSVALRARSLEPWHLLRFGLVGAAAVGALWASPWFPAIALWQRVWGAVTGDGLSVLDPATVRQGFDVLSANAAGGTGLTKVGVVFALGAMSAVVASYRGMRKLSTVGVVVLAASSLLVLAAALCVRTAGAWAVAAALVAVTAGAWQLRPRG